MFLYEILKKHQHSEKIALQSCQKSISYKSLYNKAVELSNSINKLNSGSNIGLLFPNSINYVMAYFAISLSKKIIVPIRPRLKKTELLNIVRYCELKLIITNSDNFFLLKKLLSESDSSVSLINVETNEIYLHQNSEKETKPVFSEKETDTALLLHTSGTSAKPKKVMLSHKNLIANLQSIIHSLQLAAEDKTLIVLPLFMASANTSQMLTHLYLGATICIMDGVFYPQKLLALLEKEKISNFTSVPAYLNILLDYKNIKKYKLNNLKFICFGGAKSGENNIKRLIKKFPGIHFIHMYGQTEATTRISHLLPVYMKSKLGSVGKPIPSVQVRIVDDNFRDVTPGQTGEIIVKGDNIMQGYYKRPEETGKVVRDGWLKTGDLGRFDQDGFIYITGRKKNIIISGGENIYPEEIEEILCSHPGVKEALVCARYDKYLNEVPMAKVVLNEGEQVSGEDLIRYCAIYLTNFKIPTEIVFTENLAKSVTGKILRVENINEPAASGIPA